MSAIVTPQQDAVQPDDVRAYLQVGLGPPAGITLDPSAVPNKPKLRGTSFADTAVRIFTGRKTISAGESGF